MYKYAAKVRLYSYQIKLGGVKYLKILNLLSM